MATVRERHVPSSLQTQADERAEKPGNSSENAWSRFLKFDKDISRSMSICCDASSKHFGKRCLRIIMMLLEVSGHGIPWLAMAAYFAYTSPMATREFSSNLLIALLFDLVVVGTFKIIVQRKRPDYNVDDMVATVQVDKFSFPSGHTTRGILTAILLSRFIISNVLVAVIHVWALVLALSRVVLGRHHITDVAAGYLIGIWEAVVILDYIWIDNIKIDYLLNTVINFISR